MMLKDRYGRIIQLSLVILVMTCIVISPGRLVAQEASDNRDEIDDQREKLEELNEEMAALESELQEKSHAKRQAMNLLDDISKQLADIESELKETHDILERKTAMVETLNRNLNQAIEDLAQRQDKFEERLVEWYKSGVGSVMGSILVSGDLSDFLFAMRYTEAIIEGDNDDINFIREQQGKLFSEKDKLDQEIARKRELIDQMRDKEKELTELQARREHRFIELKSDEEQVRQALSILEADSYEIKMVLKASTYTGSLDGKLIPPVDSYIKSGFGMRRHPILGVMRMHSGIDLPAAHGTPIHAAGKGRVDFAGWKRGYGYAVLINHGQGLATLYAHCSTITVREGEEVDRGQVIAKVGSTGLSTGPHVHFEVRVDGEPEDPVYYIQ